MSIKVLHLADLHLGAPLRWLGDRAHDRREDLKADLVRAIDTAIERVDLVMFAGDTFDSHRPADELVEFFRKQIARLDEAGIPAVLVPGNHDAYYYPDSVWRVHKFPGVSLITPPNISEPMTLDIKGTQVHLYGMTYQPTLSNGPFDNFKRTDDPGVHIAVIHGSLMHSKQWGVHSRDCPLDPQKLGSTGMDYIALGHFHRFSETNAQGISVVYPGTLEGVTMQETGDRYLVMVTFDDGGVQVEKEIFQSRTIYDLELDVTGWEESNTEQVTSQMLKMITSPDDIYQITIRGSAGGTIDFATVQAGALEKCFFLRLIDDTVLLEGETIDRIAQEPTVRGGFVRAVRERKQKDWELDDRVAEMALRYGLELFIQKDAD